MFATTATDEKSSNNNNITIIDKTRYAQPVLFFC